MRVIFQENAKDANLLDVFSPFNVEFKDVVKALPVSERSWDPLRKCWVFDKKYAKEIIRKACDIYGMNVVKVNPQKDPQFKAAEKKRLIDRSGLLELTHFSVFARTRDPHLGPKAVPRLNQMFQMQLLTIEEPPHKVFVHILRERLIVLFGIDGKLHAIEVRSDTLKQLISAKLDDNWFGMLGLPTSAQVDARMLKSNYRKLALEHHPDHGGDPEKFLRVKKAYESLKDEKKRKRYLVGVKLAKADTDLSGSWQVMLSERHLVEDLTFVGQCTLKHDVAQDKVIVEKNTLTVDLESPNYALRTPGVYVPYTYEYHFESLKASIEQP